MKNLSQRKYPSKGFTLIELLVVIAIIGLLSSIVLVSVNSARQKAKIAAGMRFAGSLYHGLGSEAVGIWNFDEGSGGTANDTSGYSNNGTITGASWSDDTPNDSVGSGNGKYSLSFDGVGDYVDMGNASSLNIGSSFTASAWVKITDPATDYQGILIKAENDNPESVGQQGWELIYRSVSVGYRFHINDENNLTTSAVSGLPSGSLQDWHFVSGVYNASDHTAKLFIDGVEKVSRSYTPASFNAVGNNFKVGKISTLYSRGLIDDVSLYASPLSITEIKKLYAEGRETHQLAEGLSANDVKWERLCFTRQIGLY